MATEKIDTVVVGGGQAGLAMSEHLSRCHVPHVVLERHRIAERWRSERWDSLMSNGPAWHDRFPGMTFPGFDPDEFVPKDKVAEYFVAYSQKIAAPVRCGVDVTSVRKIDGTTGFRVVTSDGLIEARRVVAATGAFQRPVIPTVVPDDAGLTQLHSSTYRNPQQLPAGAVLVVGAGSSGGQIADELLRAGRNVYLSVGPHDRPPRAYRGRDYCWWLGVLGKWDAQSPGPATEHVTIAVSGARGGQTVDYRRLADEGVILLGRTASFQDRALTFAPDLADNLARGDAHYFSVLDEADTFAVRNGIELPEDLDARRIWPDPECVTDPILRLDPAEVGITSIIWATGYVRDYSWLDVDVLDETGKPRHERGVSIESGIYFLGLPWQSRRGSSFIWGVWHDAKYLADHIVNQQKYMAYHEAANDLAKVA